MKQQINEIRRMQQLAGLIKENEMMDGEEEFDYDAAFDASPNEHSYEDILDVVKGYEDESYLNSFISTFPKGKPVSKEDWVGWSRSMQDYDPEGYTYLNWISLSDPDIYDKAGVI